MNVDETLVNKLAKLSNIEFDKEGKSIIQKELSWYIEFYGKTKRAKYRWS